MANHFLKANKNNIDSKTDIHEAESDKRESIDLLCSSSDILNQILSEV